MTPVTLKVVNPLDIPDWDDLILSFQDYSFFHTSAWARVLVDTYGYNPVYVTMYEGKDLSAVVPIMEVNSFLTGKRGVGLPFTDHCEPLSHDNLNFGRIFEALAEYGKKNRWTYIEFRCGPLWVPSFVSGTASITGPGFTGLNSFFPGEMNNNASAVPFLHEHDSLEVTYWGHFLDLLPAEKAVFDSFRSSTRRSIKKAVRAGVEVSFQRDFPSMKTYFRLHALTRKRHGMPPQPFKFFQKTFELVIARGNGLIALASWKGKVVAGAVFLFTGSRFVYKFGASDKKFQELRANNLIMSEAIQWACREGFTTFDFGRTEPENEGLRQFKNGWGTREVPLQYFRWGVSNHSWEIQSSNSNSKVLTQVFRKLPVPALKFIGRIMYGHMG